MIIDEIKVNAFGNLKDVNISLKPGINLINGSNESGKSTLASFIRCSFYGISKNKNGKEFSDFERYKPWDETSFAGNIKYNIDGENYLLRRDFSKNKATLHNSFGEDVTSNFDTSKTKGSTIGIEQFGIDEDTFVNTMLVNQNEIVVDVDSQRGIVQRLSNILNSGDEEYSFDDLISKVDKRLYDEVGTDRTSTKPKCMLKREIADLEIRESKLSRSKKREEEILEEKIALCTDATSSVKKLNELECIYKIKKKYEEELQSEKIKFDAEQKVIAEQIEHEKKKIKNKKIIDTIMISLATIALVGVLIAIDKLMLGLLSIVIGIFFAILNCFVSYKEVITAELKNFDMILEEIRKKESRELNNFENKVANKKYTDARISELSKEIEKTKDEVQKIELSKHKLEIEEESIKEDLLKYNDVVEELYYKKEEQQKVLKKERVINLAKAKLEEAYDEIKRAVIPKLEKEIEYTVSKATNGEYKEIKYNDENGVVCYSKAGELININKLSVGTIDQIYLGFRLAIADKYGNIPIIFDEAFVYFDDTRLENMLKTLSDISETKQIILLSCSRREKELMDKLKISYNFVNL